MENPTFKLEGIVKTKNELEDFEGPLTLILQMLSKNKIEIKDIQISSLLDQYMEYLEEMKSMDLEIASEFVSMASYLVYIKTKTLLDEDEENSELQQLISSLESLKCRDTYALIKQVTDEFGNMYKRGGGLIVKPPEYLPVSKEYTYKHQKEDVLKAIQRVFDRGEAFKAARNVRPFEMPKRIVYSVSEKTEEILNRLRISGVLRASVCFTESRSRTELVATFIAILELCKAGRIAISGGDEDYIVSYVEQKTENFEGDSE